MFSTNKLLATAVLCSVCISGCGGGANSLTGGSVPTGGRSITGTAVLPNASPAANATVRFYLLPVGTLIKSTITDSNGTFTATDIPTGHDLDIVISQPPSSVLETVIPQVQLNGSTTTLNIGEVNAISSIVAAAIKLEQRNNPEDENSIVSNQGEHLTMFVQGQGFSPEQQNQLINNQGSMNAQALALMIPVANAELEAMNSNLSTQTAQTALNGVLGYLRAAHARAFHLDMDVKSALIQREVSGTTYLPIEIASALQQAGQGQTTGNEVAASSARERGILTSLGTGPGISSFEALVIAADVSTSGGFGCDQNTLNNFLRNLLKY